MSEVEKIKDVAIAALEDLKAVDMTVLDVRGKSSVTDYMIVVSGTSSRHLKALANSVVVESKKAGYTPLGIEGADTGEWVLVDLGDVVVHVMTVAIRDFYQLEKLWSADPKDKEASGE